MDQFFVEAPFQNSHFLNFQISSHLYCTTLLLGRSNSELKRQPIATYFSFISVSTFASSVRNASNMTTERPIDSFTPLKAAPQAHHANATLTDVAKELGDVAQAYESDFATLTEGLLEVADTVVELNDQRLHQISELKDDLANWQHSLAKAQKSAQDTESLRRYRQETAQLEQEKKILTAEIYAGTEENDHFNAQLNKITRQLDKVRIAHDALKEQADTDLPSLQYLRRVLVRVSQAKICSKPDSTFIEGFIAKDKQQEVRPFHFDDNLPDASLARYEAVNDMWKIVSE